MAEKIKRLNYFDGLILKEDQFNAEQAYHVRMRRLHNHHLHGWGIVYGLMFAIGNQSDEVRITEGMALDRITDPDFNENSSREIILDQAREIFLGGYDSEGTHHYTVGEYVYIWVSYKEEQTDVVPELGRDRPIYRNETIQFGHGIAKPIEPEDTKQYIILGKVYLKPNQADPTTYGIDSDCFIYEEDGQSLRVLSGASQTRVETENLTLVNGQMVGAAPYFQGIHAADPDIEGIQVVSGLTSFSGDLQVNGGLTLSTGDTATEVSSDTTLSSSNAGAIPTVQAVKGYVDNIGGDANTRLDEIANNIYESAEPSSIPRRTDSGTIKAARAATAGDTVIIEQLQERGYTGNIQNYASVTDLDTVMETGFYSATSSATSLPIAENGIVIVLKESSNAISQEFRSTITAKRYTRLYQSNIWTLWIELLTQDNMDDHIAGTDHDAQYVKRTGGELDSSLNAGGNQIQNLGTPQSSTDAALNGDVQFLQSDLNLHKIGADHDDRYYNLSGDSLDGNMNANGWAIIGLPDPTALNDDTAAARLLDVQSAIDIHKTSSDHDGRYVASLPYTGLIDDLVNQGVYTLYDNTDLPSGITYGTITVNPSTDGAYVNQTLVTPEDQRIMYRFRAEDPANPGTFLWGGWQEFWTNTTVTRDETDPEGMGCWIRYPDGSMIQYGTIRLEQAPPYTKNFPQLFSSVKQVRISSLSANVSYTCMPEDWSNGSFTISGGMEHRISDTDPHSAASAIYVNWYAIGTH